MSASLRRSSQSTPLAHTTLTVSILDLLAEFEMRHEFRNQGKKAIEAVYSFPMPLDAAFIEMRATLAGETRVAQVMPASKANETYDDAISEGHSAVLIEQLEPGLLCVNLGNLLPGETGEVVLHFAAQLNVADGVARFSLPLVHRPRYGRSRLDEIVQPRNDFAVEHPLTAEIRIRGLLASRPIQCTTAAAQFSQDAGETVLRIDHAALDRDLVLSVDLGTEPLAQAHWVQDGEAGIGVVNVSVPHAPVEEQQGLDLCLLLDGSGSMQGDAIAQSRQAMIAIADALQERDRIQVIRFGSGTHPLFRRPLRATDRVKQALHELHETVDADLGGTEMAGALREALSSLATLDGEASRKVILLVTDGAVNAYAIANARDEAARLGIRIFVVAVGSSAGVDVLAPLAEATRATLERAVPAEPIDAGVMRQFRRARGAPARIAMAWSDPAADVLPLGIVYPGDAFTAIARFAGRAACTVNMVLPGMDSSVTFSSDQWQASAAWRAWAGQCAYRQLAPDSPEREALAMRYGLIVEETKAVLVKQRAEADRAEGLPEVTSIAHMVPAGMIDACKYSLVQPLFSRRSRASLDFERMDLKPLCCVGFESEEDELLETQAPPCLDAAACTELAKALLLLALDRTSDSFEADDLLKLVSENWHESMRAYLDYFLPSPFDRGGAAALLYRLIDEGASIDISDDQEAELALLKAQV